MALSKVSKYTLNNGHQIPVAGFGVYQTPPAKTRDVVYQALKIGYRHIDSARAYSNEAQSADGIAKFLADHPSVSRSDIFFTSKVVNRSPIGKEDIIKQVQESVDRIKDQIGYIDLYLLHSPYPNKETRFAQWEVLQDFVAKGDIRSIGVSNFNVKHMDELFAWEGLKVKPVINQLELQPWLPRKDIQENAKKHGYHLEAYGPLTQGKRFGDPELVKIAEKHGVTPAAVLLRWSYDQGFIPLAKSVTPSRIEENYNVLETVTLDEEDKKILDKPESYQILAGWDPTTFEG